jgi:hypothetical protein
MKIFFWIALLFSLSANSQTPVLDSNIRAQTMNQLSQANYYSKLEAKNDNTWLSILSVLIAGLISFGSAAYLSVKALQNEKKKSLEIQEKEFSTAKQLAASTLISKTAQGIHNVTWVLWIARFTPELFTDSIVKDHDKLMYILYAEIVAAQVVLAAYDKELFIQTKVIVDELYGLDGELGGIAGGLYKPSERAQSITQLGVMWSKAHRYLRDLPVLFSSKL